MAVVAVDRPAARGCSERDRAFDRVHGNVVCWLGAGTGREHDSGGGCRAGIALATPPLWTTWRPRWLPWYLESYINGVHIYNKPQPWLFPIFPWAAFAFAGLAVGFLLFSDWAERQSGATTVSLLGAAGVALYYLSMWLDASPVHLYASTTTGTRARIFSWRAWRSCWWSCSWGMRGAAGELGSAGFSPLIQMGQTSLLVYWVHIEFVYGRFSILTKRAQTIPDGDGRPAGDFCGDGAAVDGANAVEGSRRGNSRVVATVRRAVAAEASRGNS